MEIRESEVYSPEEVRQYLKVSTSTIMRMIRKGYLPAAKVGKQYRIRGRELLRMVSPGEYSTR